MSLFSAFLSRWDDASLNSTVADLSRSSGEDEFGAFPEDLAGKALPRAQFHLTDEQPVEFTTSYRLRQCVVNVTVFHNSDALLETALDSIESAIDNSENAGTDPMAVSGGTIINVQFSARNQYPETEGVFRGYVEFELTWQKLLSTPA
jgi:hypothetical protein